MPELEVDQAFVLDPARVLAEIDEARAVGVEPRPVILGPVSFLRLSKLAHGAAGTSPLALLEPLLPIYDQLLGRLAAAGIRWVQLDEPCLVTDLDDEARAAYHRALPRLARAAARPAIVLATYFGDLADNLPLVVGTGLEALHVDLVRAPDQLAPVLAALGDTAILSLGVVDGRDILGAIGELDADVLSIETSRSRMELFGDFRRVGYPNEVGPGVYDIHSPRVPSTEEICDLLTRAAAVLPAERLWVNPDCGLKTRGWPEVEQALGRMVDAARRVRRQLAGATAG